MARKKAFKTVSGAPFACPGCGDYMLRMQVNGKWYMRCARNGLYADCEIAAAGILFEVPMIVLKEATPGTAKCCVCGRRVTLLQLRDCTGCSRPVCEQCLVLKRCKTCTGAE